MASCNGNHGPNLSNLTAEEVRDIIPSIDGKALAYIKEKLPIETEDPILVLDFVLTNDFQWNEQRKQQVANALTTNIVGGQQISVGPTCFQFATPESLIRAKDMLRLQNNIHWAFNYSVGSAQRINATFEQLNPGHLFVPIAPTPPKIRTDIISFFSEQSQRLTITQDTKFFEI